MGHVHGVAGQQQLVDGIIHGGRQVFYLAHRDLVDAGFLLHVGAGGVLGNDAVGVIGQGHHVPVTGESAHRLDEVRREGVLHQHVAGLAIDDLAAVVA